MTDVDRDPKPRTVRWPAGSADTTVVMRTLRRYWPPDDTDFLARVSDRIRAAAPERGADFASRVHVELDDHAVVLRCVRAEWPPDDPEFLSRIGEGWPPEDPEEDPTGPRDE